MSLWVGETWKCSKCEWVNGTFRTRCRNCKEMRKMVNSVKLLFNGTTVHVATGYASKEEAQQAIDQWRADHSVSGQPLFITEEPSGDPEEDTVDLQPDDGKSGYGGESPFAVNPE